MAVVRLMASLLIFKIQQKCKLGLEHDSLLYRTVANQLSNTLCIGWLITVQLEGSQLKGNAKFTTEWLNCFYLMHSIKCGQFGVELIG